MTDPSAAPDLAAIRDVIAKWHMYRGQLPRVFDREIVTSDKELERENVLIDCFLADLDSLLAVPPARPENENVVAAPAEPRRAWCPECGRWWSVPDGAQLDGEVQACSEHQRKAPARSEPPAERVPTKWEEAVRHASHDAAVALENVELKAQVQALQQERVQALEILATQSGSDLLDACRQVKQVAISEADNSNLLDARLRDLQTTLERYGRHEMDCVWWAGRRGCTCGLSAALASLPASETPGT